MAFADNLVALRKYKGMSQEDLAAAIGVSRQTLSKYETGESVPDIERTQAIARVFGTSIDELVTFEPTSEEVLPPPRGKHLFGVVTVGDRGQIVIPAEARRIFRLNAGDRLMVLVDEGQGIALIGERDFLAMAEQVRKMGVR
ncbi:MAG: helix-turn-helix domain-containing protein [Eggerthellaceae bacterium]|nr:helix-turn-helix domain-containing protein [Eggerthellaceae bacterium]